MNGGGNLKRIPAWAIVKKTQNEERTRRKIVMRKKKVGIDLGTTNSVMAIIIEDVPEIVR